ncbi:hypothetical protein HYDPIDRAFT_38740 [Hydnomerulius pinastri MD-312]|nr:hypothetical protein HYDPIDRAFT_38740 [Hydnomerulius pinastri MD-312]
MDSRVYNADHELRLRRHIREILLPYARIHLTTDHVAFTEVVVEELLLLSLHFVPMADATSFLLPTEPFEVLIKFLDTLDLKPIEDERWSAPAEAIQYIKDHFSPPLARRELPSDRCWQEEGHAYERVVELCRPMSPVLLTNRARRETPKCGDRRARASVPRTESALSNFIGLACVPNEPIVDLPVPAVDDVLDLRFKLDASKCTETRSFLRSVLAPSGGKSRGSFDNTPNVDACLQWESPRRHLPRLDSPPLFPRVAQTSYPGEATRANTKPGGQTPFTVKHIAHFTSMKRAPIEFLESEDGNINGHHMEVVNGWVTYTISSPPPPSPHGSSSSEADELWEMSPPVTPATSIIAARIEEVEIPRVRKFGHKSKTNHHSIATGGTAELLTATKSPGSFITSLRSSVPVPMKRTPVQTPKPSTPRAEAMLRALPPLLLSSPAQSTLNSLLGQPPSALKGEDTNVSASVGEEGGGETDLDIAVATIYASAPHDPMFCILEEKLDEQEALLMDVPDLPPPTGHPKEPTYFLQVMENLVAPNEKAPVLQDGIGRRRGAGPTAFLRQVKGVKPLALELSWMPFKFGNSIPTNEEVARIGSTFRLDDETPEYVDETKDGDTREFLDLAVSPALPQVGQGDAMFHGCEELGASPIPKRDPRDPPFDYVLTKRERMKLSGISNFPGNDDEEDEGGSRKQENEITIQYQARADRLDQSEFLLGGNEGQTNTVDMLHQEPAYRNFHTHHVPMARFNDSGVDFSGPGRDEYPRSFQAPSDSPNIDFPPGPGLESDLSEEVDELEADKENIDQLSEDKENLDPRGDNIEERLLGRDHNDSGIRHLLAHDWDINMAPGLPNRNEPLDRPAPSFELLPFVSRTRSIGAVHTHQSLGRAYNSSSRRQRTLDNIHDTGSHFSDLAPTNGVGSTTVAKRRRLDDVVPASSRDLFSAFVELRNQVPASPITMHSEHRDITPSPKVPVVLENSPLRVTPDDVFDQHTVRLPEQWISATTTHRYLASMALIQKRALVRDLQDGACRAALVERYDLGGTDIVLDPDHGVLFIPLLALPAQLESVVDRISCESWRYPQLLIIFEAYPSTQSYRVGDAHNTRLVPYAYSPAVCKTIKKLRRILGIAEGCGTMNPRCTITWAFSNRVEESARFVRCFGEEACAKAFSVGNEVLWGEREWLEEEEREGESDLASVHGMNAFAAFVMLYERPLHDILDLSSEARMEEFGQLLGSERVSNVNAVIEKRMQEMAAIGAGSVIDCEY